MHQALLSTAKSQDWSKLVSERLKNTIIMVEVLVTGTRSIPGITEVRCQQRGPESVSVNRLPSSDLLLNDSGWLCLQWHTPVD